MANAMEGSTQEHDWARVIIELANIKVFFPYKYPVHASMYATQRDILLNVARLYHILSANVLRP